MTWRRAATKSRRRASVWEWPTHANRGDLDHAFTWFDRAYNQRESEMGMIKVNPLLKNAQADPRFSKLLQKMDLLD
jgi:hypothetical protein